MRLRPALLAPPLVTLLLACGTEVDLVSLPSRSLSEKVQRVFIVYTPPAGGSGHLQTELDSVLAPRLQARNVNCQGWVKNFLDLQEDAKLGAAQAAFHPRHLLSIRQTALEDGRAWTPGGGWSPNGPAPVGGHYSETHATTMELDLKDLGSQEVVWKARLTCRTSAAELDAATLSDRILAALTQDGVIPAATR